MLCEAARDTLLLGCAFSFELAVDAPTRHLPSLFAARLERHSGHPARLNGCLWDFEENQPKSGRRQDDKRSLSEKKKLKKSPHDFWAFFFWLTGHFCFDVSHARCTRRIRLCESCTKFRSARICQTVSQTRKPARGEKITYLQMLPGRAIFSIFLLVSFLSWNSFSIIEIKKVTSRMP